MKLISFVVTFFALFISVGQVSAEWIRVTGSGVIINGDVSAARNAAREDALYQASLQFGAEVSGRDRLELGRLTESTVDIRSKATVKDIKAVSESSSNGSLEVVFDVDVYSGNQCDSTTASGYRKHVGMLGFALQNPDQARMGGLNSIERALAATLTQFLNNSKYILPHAASQIRLYAEALNAPTHETQQRTLSKAVAEARELGVQFVVSGIVRSVALRDEKAYRSSLLSRSLRLWQLADLQREFIVDLFVHDGFSGAMVFEKRYRAEGLWEAERMDKVAFMSPAFQELDYGKQVLAQLQLMALDIESSISCQPFMARITRIEDRDIMFAAGANAGIRPGDKFQLYRSRQLFSGTQFQGTRLTAVQQVLQVSQVQPEFSAGKLNTDPGRINIQEDDVLVRW